MDAIIINNNIGAEYLAIGISYIRKNTVINSKGFLVLSSDKPNINDRRHDQTIMVQGSWHLNSSIIVHEIHN